MKRGIPETVVITGASAGIGRAAVREFAKNGANIALLARGSDGLEAKQLGLAALGAAAAGIGFMLAGRSGGKGGGSGGGT